MKNPFAVFGLFGKAAAVVKAFKAHNWAMVGGAVATLAIGVAQVFFSADVVGSLNAGLAAACRVSGNAAPVAGPAGDATAPARIDAGTRERALQSVRGNPAQAEADVRGGP